MSAASQGGEFNMIYKLKKIGDIMNNDSFALHKDIFDLLEKNRLI